MLITNMQKFFVGNHSFLEKNREMQGKLGLLGRGKLMIFEAKSNHFLRVY
jgi:hypothetical protein